MLEVFRHIYCLETFLLDILAGYIGDDMESWCKSWSDFGNKLMNTYPNSFEKCKSIFRFSSLRELEFWHMSYNNKLLFIK